MNTCLLEIKRINRSYIKDQFHQLTVFHTTTGFAYVDFYKELDDKFLEEAFRFISKKVNMFYYGLGYPIEEFIIKIHAETLITHSFKMAIDTRLGSDIRTFDLKKDKNAYLRLQSFHKYLHDKMKDLLDGDLIEMEQIRDMLIEYNLKGDGKKNKLPLRNLLDFTKAHSSALTVG